MSRIFRLVLYCLLCTAYSSLSQAQPTTDSPCNQGRAIAPRVDPRNPFLICMPEYARSTVHYNIQPLGDLNHDGIDDWAVRTGPTYRGGTLVIYFGKQGRLPEASEYSSIIHTTEDSGLVSYVGYGDWDGDGNIDICTSIELQNDTSFGNTNHKAFTAMRAIFWGDSTGHFSIQDTTQLPCDGGDPGMWGIGSRSITHDFDGDHIEDLFLFTNGRKYRDGKWSYIPEMYLYRGHMGKRWGRDGVSALPDWYLWSLPTANQKQLGYPMLLDQDGDGVEDIGIRNFANIGTAKVSIIYGKKNALPDTNEVQTADLKIANGHSCLFSDVTGDGIPELLVHAVSEEQVKVYIGLKGQRLLEQYGTGNDTAHPGEQKWWGKPWARVWLPGKINDFWDYSMDAVLDLGDADSDGINDIWIYCQPYLMMYHTGEFLDSLSDALVDVRPMLISGYYSERVEAVMKNIDGSNIPTIVIGTTSGTIFVRGTKEIQGDYGWYRKLPDGTGKPDVGVQTIDKEQRTTIVEAVPNPGNGEIMLRWTTGGKTDVVITDATGKEVLRTSVTGSEYRWNTNGVPAGIYFAKVQTGNTTGRIKVIVIEP